MTIRTTNASTNGPVSTMSASAEPMNRYRNPGSSSIWATSSSGVAASRRRPEPPASPEKTIT
ncbi:hypothetical protein SMICM304S_06050 [Streptomyces microflavus]